MYIMYIHTYIINIHTILQMYNGMYIQYNVICDGTIWLCEHTVLTKLRKERDDITFVPGWIASKLNLKRQLGIYFKKFWMSCEMLLGHREPLKIFVLADEMFKKVK